MNPPRPKETLQAALLKLSRAQRYEINGEPEKAQLHLEDSVGLAKRATDEFTGECVSHEYIGGLVEYDEYEMAQILARYKREAIQGAMV